MLRVHFTHVVSHKNIPMGLLIPYHTVGRLANHEVAAAPRIPAFTAAADRAAACTHRVTFSQYLITDHGRDLLHKVES